MGSYWQKWHSLIGFCAAIFLSGCATVGGLSPGQGRSTVINETSFATVWKAAMNCVSRNLTIVESDKEQGRIKAEHGVTGFSWGEVVGVFISRLGGGTSSIPVEVVSRKKMRTQITGPDWEPTIMECIKAECDAAAEVARTRPVVAALQDTSPIVPVSSPHSDIDIPSYTLKENSNNYAVIIGVEKYASLPPAEFAERDAEAVRAHLMALGYPARNIYFLDGQQATRAKIAQSVNTWLPNRVEENSTAVSRELWKLA